MMTLPGKNSYTGTTTVNGGILQASGAGTGGHAFGVLSAVTLANTSGVALDLNSTNQTIGSLAGGGTTGGTVTLGTGTLSTGGDNTTTTFAGVLTGTGGLTKVGMGTMTLTGANSYSGGTTVSAGSLRGDTTSLQGNILNNVSLDFNQGANGTYSSTITGTGTTTKIGTGSLTVTGSVTQGNMLLGQGLLVNAGTVRLTGDLGMVDATTLTNNAGASITAGTITGNGASQVINNRGSITATTVDLGDGNDSMTVSGNALISEIGTLSGGGGTDALLFDGWVGNPADGKGYLGREVTNWERIQLTNNSKVHLGVNKNIGAGEMTVDAGSVVYAYGASPATYTITGDYVNNGLLSLMDPSVPGADDKVTVTKNWSGVGTLDLDVSLSTGAYDQLVVQGNATGTTTVNLQEVQGWRALIRPTHLDLVHVNGTGQGSFVAGKYTFNYGSGTSIYNYNLAYDPSTGTYMLSNFILQNYTETMAVLHGVTPFIERMGVESVSRFADRTEDRCGWWTRAYGDSYRVDMTGRAGTHIDAKAGGVQVGTDLFSTCAKDGTGSKGGLLLGWGYGEADVAGYHVKTAGKLIDRTYSAGMYAESKPSQNFRLDAVAMGTYHSFDLSVLSDGQKFNTNMLSFTGSLETAYTIAAGESFNLEPQARLIYQYTGETSVTRPDIGEARILNHNGLQGKVGIAGIMNNGNGNLNPFFEISALKDFSNDTRVLLVRNNETIRTTPESTYVGGALGIRRSAANEEGLGYFLKVEGLFGTENGQSRNIMMSAGLTKSF